MAFDLEKMSPAHRLIAQDLINRETNLKEMFHSQFEVTQRKISEEAFIAFFLPWLCGEVEDTNGELHAAWLNIAGDLFTPVILIDTSGKAVATVPGLTDRNVVGIKVDRSNAVQNILEQSARISELNVEQGISNTIQQLTTTMGVRMQQGTPQWVAQWGELLKRYGKHPAQLQSQAGSGTSSPSSDPDELFDFE